MRTRQVLTVALRYLQSQFVAPSFDLFSRMKVVASSVRPPSHSTGWDPRTSALCGRRGLFRVFRCASPPWRRCVGADGAAALQRATYLEDIWGRDLPQRRAMLMPCDDRLVAVRAVCADSLRLRRMRLSHLKAQQAPSLQPLRLCLITTMRCVIVLLSGFVVLTAVVSPSVQAATADLTFKSANLTADSSDVGEVRAADTGASTKAQTTHIQSQIRSGAVKSRGVNLGGWLIAENWMTQDAAFWKGVSDEDRLAGEYTAITKSKNPDDTRAKLETHHATFITESDIASIAAAGLNTVRVPVGYWIVGFDNNDSSKKAEWKTYTTGTLKYLDLLIRTWAKKHNIAVLISIHGAKGSQNGADHSSPTNKGKAYWSDYPENVQNTVAVATFLANRYKSDAAFLGIGLMNEPTLTTKEAALYQYYQDAYTAIRGTGNDCVLTVAPLLYKQNADTMVGFMQVPTYKNVWVEWHPYFVWGYENTTEADLINVSVKTEYQAKLTKWHARANHNRLFFGEWSFATSNKFGNSKTQFYEFAEAQVKVHNQAAGGWTFWSWRTYGDENGFNGWSLRSVLRDAKLKQILMQA
ncbi:Glucan 1,3-beta-glucosidase, partial [Globisporangium splendens]